VQPGLQATDLPAQSSGRGPCDAIRRARARSRGCLGAGLVYEALRAQADPVPGSGGTGQLEWSRAAADAGVERGRLIGVEWALNSSRRRPIESQSPRERH